MKALLVAFSCTLAAGWAMPGCAKTTRDEGPSLGSGGATSPLRDCLGSQCDGSCTTGIVSRVTLVDWDESDGAGQAVTVVEPFAPIRIVGAGSSTCVPVFVP